MPAGTWITVRVNQPISSDHNQQGDPFTATLAQPLVDDESTPDRVLLRAFPVVGLHWVDGEANILWANKADYEPLGYTEDEYVGHNITEFHADADVINDILERLLSGQSLYNYKARLLCKDGSTKSVLIASSGLFDDANNFVHTRCFTIEDPSTT